MKTLIGILVGLLIGAICRFFDIPAPCPPKLIGALLVVSTTAGYILTDAIMTRNSKRDLSNNQGIHSQAFPASPSDSKPSVK